MDRMIVYPGAIPLDTDLLNVERGVMKGLGFLAQACLGTQTVVDGLSCRPTLPTSMQVVVGPGSILTASQVDETSYGTLASDPSNLMKMGINIGASTFTLTAPGGPGQSINYMIEASFQEEDAVPVVLPYYNASNPAQGLAGQGNNGSSQMTQRLQVVALQMKAGAAANTGTQNTPPADAGWTAIAVITVNAGQSTVEAYDIVVPQSAPFMRYKLPQMTFTCGLGKTGWQSLPSGLIMQWGTGVTVSGELEPVNFPLAFPNTVYCVTVSEGAAGGWNNPAYPVPVPTIYGVNDPSATGFKVSCLSPVLNGANSSIAYAKGAGYNWMAYGA
jgi:hypothetical protein